MGWAFMLIQGPVSASRTRGFHQTSLRQPSGGSLPSQSDAKEACIRWFLNNTNRAFQLSICRWFVAEFHITTERLLVTMKKLFPGISWLTDHLKNTTYLTCTYVKFQLTFAFAFWRRSFWVFAISDYLRWWRFRFFFKTDVTTCMAATFKGEFFIQ